MRAVLYCRVSTAEQTLNLSLATQEHACRDYAEREGFEVAAVFVDRGESAKTTDRPEFRNLIAYCRKQAGHVHAVVVYGLSRFSRNSADHHTIAALLRGYGVALRSVTEPIDDSPAGRFMEGILAAMAQFDNDVRADRTKVGMKAATDRGRWVWQAPLGYRNGYRAGGEPSLVPAEHAEAIRSAFLDLAECRRSAAQVYQQLRAVGVKGRRSELSPQTLHRLIRNPVYCGRLRSETFGIDRPGDWAPLVDEATWHRAQLRLEPEQDAPVRVVEHPDFPLRRFVHCGTCGRSLTGGWSTGRSARYGYYHCRRHCLTTPKIALETAFLDFLDRLRPTAGFLDLLRGDVLAVWRSACDQAAAERSQLEAHASRLRSQLRRLDDAFLFEHAIDQATYTGRRDEIRQQLAETELALSQATIATIDAEGLLASADYAIEHGSALWRQATTSAQRMRLQWALFPDGVIWTGSAVLNRGSRFCLYEIPAVDAAGSHMASPMGAVLNHLASWGEAWHAYLNAAA